jgi:hypothetical protein
MATDTTQFRTSIVRDYNPDQGPVLVVTYEGTEAQLNPIRANWELAGEGTPTGYGFRTNYSITANGVRLVVRIPEGTVFTDRWNIDTEVVPDPLWYSDFIRSYLKKPDGTSWGAVDMSDVGDLAAWLSFVRRLQGVVNLVRNGANINSETPEQDLILTAAEYFPEYASVVSVGLTQEMWDVVFMAIRDGEYLERNTPVLKRCRQIPLGDALRTKLVGRPLLYSTTGLIDTFGAPDDVADQLTDVSGGMENDPDLPTAPVNTRWSWKLRQNNSETLLAWGSGRALEVRDWKFGRWSTISNEFVT